MHAVGLYGPRGAGVAEHLDYEAQLAHGENPDPIPGSVMDRIDIITGQYTSHNFHLHDANIFLDVHRYSR